MGNRYTPSANGAQNIGEIAARLQYFLAIDNQLGTFGSLNSSGNTSLAAGAQELRLVLVPLSQRDPASGAVLAFPGGLHRQYPKRIRV